MTAVLAVDPGVTTGWALLESRTRCVIACGNWTPDEVGSAIDEIVRCVHRRGQVVQAVVEWMPSPAPQSALGLRLAFVRNTIDHWLVDVFEVAVEYVSPGTWKTSRVARTIELPPDWMGKPLSQHQKDAITMGTYFAERRVRHR